MMPTYVSLINWTDQGSKNVKDSVDRAEQARQVAEAQGGRLLSLYWTQGAYDLITTVDFPDEETAQAYLVSTAKLGNVRSQTMRAFSAEEMTRILAKVR